MAPGESGWACPGCVALVVNSPAATEEEVAEVVEGSMKSATAGTAAWLPRAPPSATGGGSSWALSGPALWLRFSEAKCSVAVVRFESAAASRTSGISGGATVGASARDAGPTPAWEARSAASAGTAGATGIAGDPARAVDGGADAGALATAGALPVERPEAKGAATASVALAPPAGDEKTALVDTGEAALSLALEKLPTDGAAAVAWLRTPPTVKLVGLGLAPCLQPAGWGDAGHTVAAATA
jgi:hypothetical protein